MEANVIQYIQNSLRSNWEELAFTDYKGNTYQYRDVARSIARLHLLLKAAGINPGDKIALCGKNSSAWAMTFLGVLTYGAVPVPILHEFKADNIHHIVTHSEARLLFCEANIWENLDEAQMPLIIGAMRFADWQPFITRDESLATAIAQLDALYAARYPTRLQPGDVKYVLPKRDDLALINYTSGSTGFSKGVMVPYRAIASNLRFCIEHLTFLLPGDQVICMLPLAHMYGLVIEMLHTFVKGCHIFFLTRVPSPRIIMEALATVKPKLIITVPLVIEKIVRSNVFPLLEKPYMELLLKVPFVNSRLLNVVKSRLTAALGGNLRELIIGGAALNKDVEEFLRRIGFPITVGYGMTECAPLISYAPWDENRPGSCGKIVDRLQARIDSPDPAATAGELWVKGDHTMLGYFKNTAATEAVMGADGWLNTGDLCTLDADGFLFIRGRSKNMILGPSGQNIYPEEIEQQINNLPLVNESIVIEEGGQLVALIYPDIENGIKQGLSLSDLEVVMNDNIAKLNKQLAAYERISRVKVYQEEFEKTPKRSIKRYIYQHS